MTGTLERPTSPARPADVATGAATALAQAAYLVETTFAGLAVALVVRQSATLPAWLAARQHVATYLPAMAIVGALVPVHRLARAAPGPAARGRA
jgi:hypothetical protein